VAGLAALILNGGALQTKSLRFSHLEACFVVFLLPSSAPFGLSGLAALILNRGALQTRSLTLLASPYEAAQNELIKMISKKTAMNLKANLGDSCGRISCADPEWGALQTKSLTLLVPRSWLCCFPPSLIRLGRMVTS